MNFYALLLFADFFNIFFEKFFQEYYQSVCKQFESRLARTFRRIWSESKLFTSLSSDNTSKQRVKVGMLYGKVNDLTF